MQCLSVGQYNHRPAISDKEIEQYLIEGLRSARWNTAQQARHQLQDHFKRQFNYKTVDMGKKCAGVLRVPRPVHEKKDPCQGGGVQASLLW